MKLLDGRYGGLDIERIETGLKQNDIDTPFDEPTDMSCIRVGKRVEIHFTEIHMVGIGGYGKRVGGGSGTTGHKHLPATAVGNTTRQ